MEILILFILDMIIYLDEKLCELYGKIKKGLVMIIINATNKDIDQIISSTYYLLVN